MKEIEAESEIFIVRWNPGILRQQDHLALYDRSRYQSWWTSNQQHLSEHHASAIHYSHCDSSFFRHGRGTAWTLHEPLKRVQRIWSFELKFGWEYTPPCRDMWNPLASWRTSKKNQASLIRDRDRSFSGNFEQLNCQDFYDISIEFEKAVQKLPRRIHPTITSFEQTARSFIDMHCLYSHSSHGSLPTLRGNDRARFDFVGLSLLKIKTNADPDGNDTS